MVCLSTAVLLYECKQWFLAAHPLPRPLISHLRTQSRHIYSTVGWEGLILKNTTCQFWGIELCVMVLLYITRPIIRHCEPRLKL